MFNVWLQLTLYHTQSSGDQWKSQRKIVNACLNEQCIVAAWSEAASLGNEMAHYWARKGVFTTVGEDSRTISLGVLSKTCFGQSFQFEGHDEMSPTSASTSFRFSLLAIMENALLISALGPNLFLNPWIPLPKSWRSLGESCLRFKGHMTQLYNQKLRNLSTEGHLGGDSTLMASLIRSSQRKEHGQGLTEAEIYGTMFVMSFAGHDTTAHLLTYAMYVFRIRNKVPRILSYDQTQVRPLTTDQNSDSILPATHLSRIGLPKSCEKFLVTDIYKIGITTLTSPGSSVVCQSCMKL